MNQLNVVEDDLHDGVGKTPVRNMQSKYLDYVKFSFFHVIFPLIIDNR